MTAMMKLLALGCLGVAGFAVPLVAAAQQYPARPVRVIVPYSAGTATDVLSRTVAQKLGDLWGQAVVVENMPGANGTTATALVARADPDGYTLLMIAANHVANSSLYKTLPYDTLKDFKAVARIGHASFVLCAHPKLPVKTVGEFASYAKAHPGEINYSSPGNGTPGHLAMEMLKTMSGINAVHVPYKGAAQATTDLVGGQVQSGFVVQSTAIPHIKAGRLHALAISSGTRSDKLPDVPTIAESGYPGFDLVSWIGLIAPANVPTDILAKISADVMKVIDMPEVRDRLAGIGITPFPAPASEFGPYIEIEYKKWSKLVKDSGAKLD